MLSLRRSEKSEGVSMTMIALGILLVMVGLLWVIVIDIMRAEHQANRLSSRLQEKPLPEAAHCESRAV